MSQDEVSRESQPGNGGRLGFALRGYSPVVQWLQLLLGVGVIGFLVYRLNAMGWVAIWHALPRNIWFYALFAVWYLAIPVAECFIYRRLWDCRLSHPLPILLRKRVLNFGILGYLGDGYFAYWAHQNLGLSLHRALAGIKDADILSALVSNFATVALVVAFLSTGELQTYVRSVPHFPELFLVFGGAVFVAILTAIVLRHRIFTVDTRGAACVTACHMARLIVMMLAQVGQWASVLPHVAMTTWLTFLTAQLVMTRVPFLPSQDLMNLGLGVALASVVDAPPVAIAGIFVATGALSQITNLIVFGGTALFGYDGKVQMPKPGEPGLP